MRLTRLREEGGDRVFDLHPRCTVVDGVGRDAHDAVVAACVAEAATAGAHLVVVDAAAVRRTLAEGRDPHVRRRRDAYAEAAATVDAVERALELLGAEQRALTIGREQLRTELTMRRAQLDPFAVAAVGTAELLVERLTAELGALPGSGLVDPLAALRFRVSDAEERLAAIRTGLTAAVLPGRDALEAALADAEAVLDERMVPSPEALALADEWDALQEELAELEARHVPHGAVAEASDRVDTTRTALAAALAAAGLPVEGSGPVPALEAAHERVLAAERRMVTGEDEPSSVAELERAAAVEQDLLVEHGYASWSAYVMRDRRRDDPDVLAARIALAEAEAAWAGTLALLVADADFEPLMARLAACEERAATLLGGGRPGSGPGLAAALRDLRVPPAVLGVDGDTAAERLRTCLQRAGGDAAGQDLASMVEQARGLLDGAERRDEQRTRLRAAEEATLAELAEARLVLEEAEADPDLRPVPLDDPRLARATAALGAARTRQRRHDDSLERVGELVTRLDELADEEERLDEQREAMEALLAASLRLERLAWENLEHVRRVVQPERLEYEPLEDGEWTAAVTTTLARALEHAADVVVVAGVLDDLPPDDARDWCEALARSAAEDAPQLVVVTERAELPRWAARSGFVPGFETDPAA